MFSLLILKTAQHPTNGKIKMSHLIVHARAFYYVILYLVTFAFNKKQSLDCNDDKRLRKQTKCGSVIISKKNKTEKKTDGRKEKKKR